MCITWPYHMALLFLLGVHLHGGRQKQFSCRCLLTVLPNAHACPCNSNCCVKCEPEVFVVIINLFLRNLFTNSGGDAYRHSKLHSKCCFWCKKKTFSAHSVAEWAEWRQLRGQRLPHSEMKWWCCKRGSGRDRGPLYARRVTGPCWAARDL